MSCSCKALSALDEQCAKDAVFAASEYHVRFLGKRGHDLKQHRVGKATGWTTDLATRSIDRWTEGPEPGAQEAMEMNRRQVHCWGTIPLSNGTAKGAGSGR